MPHSRASRSVLSLLLIPAIALMLAACEGGGENGTEDHEPERQTGHIEFDREPEPEAEPQPELELDPEPESMPEPQPEAEPEPEPELEPEPDPEPVDPIRQTIDEYTCTDERERVIDFASLVDHDTAAPLAWDSTPFEVYVSSSFSNAHELLAAVTDEAERVHTYLGYELFVAGDVIPMMDISFRALHPVASEAALLPADYEIPFYCCDERSDAAGHAQIFTRTAVLSSRPGSARHVIIHELYHLLGFDHDGGDEGVRMSDMLYSGRLPNLEEQFAGIDGRIPTGSTATDLAKLACIYD